jgi:hypothetical protein
MTQTPEPKPRNHAEEIERAIALETQRREREELARIEFELDCG